jgi:hypothetical protein
MNEQVIKALGRENGPTHTEFIRAEDGTYYFLETAARVGGGNIERLIEAATGLVIWQEAARIELANARGEDYAPPVVKDEFGGLIAAPSRVAYPDTAVYTSPRNLLPPPLPRICQPCLQLPQPSPHRRAIGRICGAVCHRFYAVGREGVKS